MQRFVRSCVGLVLIEPMQARLAVSPALMQGGAGSKTVPRRVSQVPCARHAMLEQECLAAVHLPLSTSTCCQCTVLPCPLPPFPPLQHPSHEPGVGRRWGWNLQFDATTGTPTAGQGAAPAGGGLQHIHHTSLGLVALSGGEEPGRLLPEDLLHPGPHTRPPTAPGRCVCCVVPGRLH